MKRLFVYFILSTFFVGTGLNAMSSALSSETHEVRTLQNKKEIKKEDLPKAVQQALQDDRFANYTISKIYEVAKEDNSKYYSIEFDYGGGQTTTIDFDENGKIIQ